MSLKFCCAVPMGLSALKSPRVVILSSEFTKLTKVSIKSRNFLNNFQLQHCRYVATVTETRKQESPIKQIYYGPLTPQLKAVKVFSLSSSIVGIIAQPFLWKEIVSTGNIPMIVAAYSFIGFFTFVTPILLHFITKKYITNLSYNEKTNTYIAKTVNFFCVTKETEFKVDDVKVPDVPGMFTTFHASGKALFVDPTMFEHPEHYAKIMGYDKPIDFKLYDSSTPNVKNEDK